MFRNNVQCTRSHSEPGYTRKLFRKPKLFGQGEWFEYQGWVAATSDAAHALLQHNAKLFEAELKRPLDPTDRVYAAQEAFMSEYTSGRTQRVMVLFRHRFIVQLVVACDMELLDVIDVAGSLASMALAISILNSGPPG